MLVKYSFKGFGGSKWTSDESRRWTGLFDLLVLFQISTSGSLGHRIPRSPGSWASKACLAGAKKGRTKRGRETPIPGGPRRQSPFLCPFPLYTPLDSYRADQGLAVTRGSFHLTQNSGNAGWYIKWDEPFRFGLTGIFGTSFKVVHFDRSGGTEMSLSMRQNCCPQYRHFVSCLQEQ